MLNDKVLEVRIENVYGEKKVYPVNTAAKIFAKIAGTKTLTVRTLIYAKDLGYTTKVQTPELVGVGE